MATEPVLIELNDKALTLVRDLMERFGERSEEDVIATAITVLDAIKDYLVDRRVTIIDRPVKSGDPEVREVDLFFERFRGSNPVRQHAEP